MIIGSCCRSSFITHTNAAVVASTKYLSVKETNISVLYIIYQHVTAILHLITVVVAGVQITMTLSGTIDFCHSITTCAIGFEVHEGIVHPRLEENWLAIFNNRGTIARCIGIIVGICIVVVTITTAEDVFHTALDVLCIS